MGTAGGKLTPLAVRRLSTLGLHADGGGLYLRVNAAVAACCRGLLMMLRISRFLSALIVGVVAGCAHTNARTDFDPSADFSRYHTYYWAGGKDISGGGSLENSLVDKRIKDVIGAQLSAKGLSEVAEDAAPDLAILYWIGARDKTSVQTKPSSAISARPVWSRYDPYWSGRWGRTYDEVVVRDYTEGTLIVDLIDANTKQLAWRAYLVQTVDKDPQKTTERLEANAMAAFAQYPPTKKSP